MAAPKLRFKEFDGDWVKTNFGKVASHISYGLTVRPEYIENGIKLISAREISTGNIDFDNAPKISISDFMLLSDKAKPQKYDLFLSKTGSIGFTSIVETDEKFAITQNIANIRLNNLSEQDPYFFLQQMRTTSFQLKAISVVNQSTIMDLQLGDIKKLEIGYPSKEEQTKIASFLSAVDEKISQLTQKHELLSQYKQGMMQKLFSQQLRFKADDGSEFGEWEEKALKTIARIYDGTHQTPNYVEDGVPFYSVEHVTANNFFKTKFIAEDVFLNELKRVQLEKNDILLTRIGDIGTSKLIDWDVRASFYVSLALIKVDKNHNSSFVNQYIKSVFFQRELHERTIHVAFPKKINLGEIGLCLIRLPCPEEQTKIANFLSAIDQKIEVVAQQIEQAKTWKKGLLQQMFV